MKKSDGADQQSGAGEEGGRCSVAQIEGMMQDTGFEVVSSLQVHNKAVSMR